MDLTGSPPPSPKRTPNHPNYWVKKLYEEPQKEAFRSSFQPLALDSAAKECLPILSDERVTTILEPIAVWAELERHKAEQAFLVKNYQRAIQHWTQAIALTARWPEVLSSLFMNRSLAHLHLRDYESALADTQATLSFIPDYPKAHVRAAICFCALGNYKQALHSLNRAVDDQQKLLSLVGTGNAQDQDPSLLPSSSSSTPVPTVEANTVDSQSNEVTPKKNKPGSEPGRASDGKSSSSSSSSSSSKSPAESQPWSPNLASLNRLLQIVTAATLEQLEEADETPSGLSSTPGPDHGAQGGSSPSASLPSDMDAPPALVELDYK